MRASETSGRVYFSFTFVERSFCSFSFDPLALLLNSRCCARCTADCRSLRRWYITDQWAQLLPISNLFRRSKHCRRTRQDIDFYFILKLFSFSFQPRLRRNFTPLFADNWAAVLQRDARAACLHSEIDKLVSHQWLNWVKEQYSAGVGCSIYNQVVRFRKQSDPKCFEPVNNQADVQLVHIQLKINSSSFDIPEDHHRGRGSWVNQIIDRTWALRADKVVSQW